VQEFLLFEARKIRNMNTGIFCLFFLILNGRLSDGCKQTVAYAEDLKRFFKVKQLS
jgi:hypothetical protein